MCGCVSAWREWFGVALGGEAGCWMPLPTRPQRFSDLASLVSLSATPGRVLHEYFSIKTCRSVVFNVFQTFSVVLLEVLANLN